MRRRVDLQIARIEVDALAKSYGLTQATRFINLLEVAGIAKTTQRARDRRAHPRPRLRGRVPDSAVRFRRGPRAAGRADLHAGGQPAGREGGQRALGGARRLSQPIARPTTSPRTTGARCCRCARSSRTRRCFATTPCRSTCSRCSPRRASASPRRSRRSRRSATSGSPSADLARRRRRRRHRRHRQPKRSEHGRRAERRRRPLSNDEETDHDLATTISSASAAVLAGATRGQRPRAGRQHSGGADHDIGRRCSRRSLRRAGRTISRS